MEHINKVEIRGNVGNIRIQTFEGNQAANFSVVTNYFYKGRDGKAIVETCWFNVTAWGGSQMPEDFNDIKKGGLVHVYGRFRDREFVGADGSSRHTLEIVANKVEILEEN